MTVLSMQSVSKQYMQGESKIQAVYNACFNVEKGEFVAIVGSSGSGKTTLLNLIGCIDEPTDGKIVIDGIDVTEPKNTEKLPMLRRQKIGFIFQDFNLLPILTAKENIILPLLLDSQPVDENYFDELTELLDIKNRLHHLPSEMSGGQKQRVAIARALINRPAIILADEPTGNLNKNSADAIMALLEMVNKQGNTVILVTHNENYANMCGRKIHIEDGNLTVESTL